MRSSSRLGIAAAVTLIVLTANILLTFYNTRQLHNDARWVDHSHQVIEALQQTIEEATEAESAARGFLISGDSEFLLGFDAKVAAAKQSIDEVARLTIDNPRQQERLPELRQRMDERLSILVRLVEMRKTNSFETVRVAMAGWRGKEEMDAIRATVKDMVAHEQGLLNERERGSEQTFWTALFTELLAGLLGVLAIITGFWLVRRHMASQRRSANVIAEQAERLRTTLSSIGDGVITTDKDGLVTNLNPVAESLTGWTNAEAAGRTLDHVFIIVNETSRAPVENPALRALKEGVIVGLANHTVLISKDGNDVPIDDSAAPIRCKAGEIVGSVLVFRDVTERRRASMILRESEARKTAMFEAALDCIISIDHEGSIVEFNAAAEKTFGYRREEVLGRDLAETIIPPAYRDGHRKGLSHYLATGEGPILNKRLELSALRADGTEFPVELTVTKISIDGSPSFTAYLRDLSESKAAAEELAKSEAFSTAVFENSPDCIKVLDADGRLLQMNANGLCLMEIDDFAALAGRPWFELWPVEAQKYVVDALESARATGIGKFEQFCPTAKGTLKWWDVEVAPVRSPTGDIYRFVSVSRDITDRKRAEEELSRSHEDLERRVIERTAEITHANLFLNALLESVREGIVACDADGVLTVFNRATRELHGLPEERLPAEKWADHYDLFQPDSKTRMSMEEVPLFRALAGEAVKDAEMVIAPKNGEPRTLLASGQAFHDVQGKVLGAVVSMHDITRRKQAEEALASAYDDLELRVAQRTEELAASEERATNVVTSIADGLITLDKEWRITYMNPRSEEILSPLEKTDAGVRGRVFWDEFPVVGSELEESYRRAMDDQVAVQIENFSEPLGRWFDIRVYPSRDGLSIYFLDITKRKQAEEALRQSEERFRLLADHMSQFAWTADATGYIYWYNERWYDYTGTTLEEMQGWGWKKVHHPDHVDRVVKRIQHSWDTGEIWEDTFPLRGKDGNYRWFLSRALPIRNADGQIVQWFGTNTDVTAEREMADELRSLAANLSEADRRKNEFLAMLAHELRNPLAPIRNALHIMRMTSGGDSSVRSASEMMERQVGQLVRLVDDLLDVSRITRGKIELRRERVELASIIYQAVEAARPSCETGGVILDVKQPDSPIYVNGDSARLNQAVGNLLNNACKFTDEGGRIDLAVVEENGAAVITVKDTGIGIAAEQLPLIFDMFVQADTSLERAVSGLGIGLTLVKNLVEMHEGAVSASSNGLGRGSEFIIRIPVLKPEAATKPPIGMIESEISKMGKLRILVVDDNVDSAESLALLLEFSGHVAAMAHDGRAAVEMASSFDPEVILLDIGLPKLNGYEAARAIRELPRGKEINLIALTGWGQPEDRDRSKEAGFDGHMVKPVDHVELMKWLEKISAEKTATSEY